MRIFFVTVLFFSFFFTAVHAQDLNIALKQVKVNYATKNFYISSVIDDRSAKESIGIANTGKQTSQIKLKGGVKGALDLFIKNNVLQDKHAQPVVLHIVKLDANISRQGTLWHISESLTLSFYAADNKVLEYTSNGHGTVNKDPSGNVEKFIRESIGADIKKFDAWWPKNKGHVRINPSVRVNVTVAKTISRPDYIVYSLQRPVQIADFKGPVNGSRQELAETVSGLVLSYTGDIKDEQLVLNITITPYFDINKSWFKEIGKTPRVLAHEQAHFDITAIKACELADALRKAKFTEDNYEQLITQLQQQNAKSSNDEEDEYDKETNHGTILDQQITWQDKLKAQVKTIGCY